MTGQEALVLRLTYAAVVLLLGVTASFMSYAFVLHLRGVRATHRRANLEGQWRGHLLDAATGEAAIASDGSGEANQGLPVPPADRPLFLEIVTDYARALHGPERRNLERVAKPYLDTLNPLLDDPDPYRRAHALDLLGELGFEEGEDRIVKGLEDESGLVAMVAARALARQADPAHVPLLLGRLAAFENWSTGYLASLMRSFGPEACPSLRLLAMDPGAPNRLRCVALQALRALNDLEAVDPAAALLPDEPNPEVQADLIRLIGTLGRPEHLDAVRPLGRSVEPHVRAVVIRALATLSDRNSSDRALVAEALDDPSPWVALQAAKGLRTLGMEQELVALAHSSSPRADLAAEVLEGRP